MHRLSALLAALLAGCAYSPGELVEAGILIRHTSSSAPRLASRCMAHNIEEFRGMPGARYAADIREGEAQGSFELVVRTMQSTLIYALVSPSKGGSDTKAWIYPNTPLIEDMAIAMGRGC